MKTPIELQFQLLCTISNWTKRLRIEEKKRNENKNEKKKTPNCASIVHRFSLSFECMLSMERYHSHSICACYVFVDSLNQLANNRKDTKREKNWLNNKILRQNKRMKRIACAQKGYCIWARQGNTFSPLHKTSSVHFFPSCTHAQLWALMAWVYGTFRIIFRINIMPIIQRLMNL